MTAWVAEGYDRRVKVSVPKVDLRLYHRSRTSSDVTGRLPEFEYVVCFEWSGETALKPDKVKIPKEEYIPEWFPDPDAKTKKKPPPGPKAFAWWAHLPKRFAVKRKWKDIESFHEALEDMAFDSTQGCRRVKAQVPKLPARGELHNFLTAVSATGDSQALKKLGRARDPYDPNRLAWEELDVMHTIYVERRLAPYFVDANRVLNELPFEILLANDRLRNFTTIGKQDLARSDPTKHRNKLLGATRACDPEEVCRVAGAIRKTMSASDMQGFIRNPRGWPQPRPPDPDAKGKLGQTSPVKAEADKADRRRHSTPKVVKSESDSSLAELRMRLAGASNEFPTLPVLNFPKGRAAWKRCYFIRPGPQEEHL